MPPRREARVVDTTARTAGTGSPPREEFSTARRRVLRTRSLIALGVYALTWALVFVVLATAHSMGALAVSQDGMASVLLVSLLLAPVLLWLVVKPLHVLGRALTRWLGGHRVLWTTLLVVAALALGVAALTALTADPALGVVAAGDLVTPLAEGVALLSVAALVALPMTVLYAALRVDRPMPESITRGLLALALQGVASW
ncbi:MULTISPECIES: hypothetical protein [Nocardiopsis]|uniref:hypothetical protein n=1 Tax=Nocardiopsis TaxID=2013 RepID=UPI0004757AC4|nr:hypothetical protein [Nocardiopsis sp. CNS-639]MCK9872290.1 hypothetical protein [Nocardiopsis dassonvillei]